MIRFIIVLAIGVLILSYLGISIRSIVESQYGQENFSYLWTLISNGWEIVVAWVTGFAENVINTVT
jgi:hypothetical protein